MLFSLSVTSNPLCFFKQKQINFTHSPKENFDVVAMREEWVNSGNAEMNNENKTLLPVCRSKDHMAQEYIKEPWKEFHGGQSEK